MPFFWSLYLKEMVFLFYLFFFSFFQLKRKKRKKARKTHTKNEGATKRKESGRIAM